MRVGSRFWRRRVWKLVQLQVRVNSPLSISVRAKSMWLVALPGQQVNIDTLKRPGFRMTLR